MIIKQTNKNNTTGFIQIPDKDIGVDQNGNLAQGYQHHDALWWQREGVNQETLNVLNNVFTTLAPQVYLCLQPKHILELGCGSGQLSYLLRQINANIVTVTVDANQKTVESPFIDQNHFIARTDQPLDFRDNNNELMIFDLIISLEHLEHITDQTLSVFIDNILKHSKPGTIFLATAATFLYHQPEQQHIHCNIKSKQEWQTLFQKYGFTPCNLPFKLNRGGNELFLTRIK